MKSVLVVEDNEKSRQRLKQIIYTIDEEIKVLSADDEDVAYALAMKTPIALFIIDIILHPEVPGDISGMDFACQLREIEKYKYTPIIFTTAVEDSKLYAYSDIHCYYYLEKPFHSEQAGKIISDALNIPQVKQTSHDVFFRKDSILYKKDIKEIIYIENSRFGQVVHLVDGELKLPYKPCKKIMENLKSDKMSQCSRYVIVNKDYVDTIDEVNRYIHLKDKRGQLEIGISYKKRFLKDIYDD